MGHNKFVNWWARYHETSPAQFWLVALLWAFVLMYALYGLVLTGHVAGSLDAQGSSGHFDAVNPSHEIDDPNPSGWQSNMARGPNNVLYLVSQTPSHGLNISWSNNNGTSWLTQQVISSSWEGHTALRTGGMVISSNNTAVIITSMSDADHNFDLYIHIRWAWAGSWETINLDSSSINQYTRLGIAINDSDCLLITVHSAVGFQTLTYDLDTKTSSGLSIYLSILGSQYGCAGTANNTGTFWVSFINWDGSTYRLYIWDLAKTIPIDNFEIFNLAVPWMGGFVCFLNNNFGWSYGFTYNEAYYICYLAYNPTTKIFSRTYVKATTDNLIYYGSGLSISYSNYVYLAWYDYTNKRIDQWAANYLGIGGAITMGIYTNATGTDSINVTGGAIGLWPQAYIPGGIIHPTNLPNNGYAHSWIFKDDLATDNIYYSIHWNANWPYFEVTLEILTDSMDNGYAGQDYVFRFHASGGSGCFTWTLIYAPAAFHFQIDNLGILYAEYPMVIGTYAITVMAEDGAGGSHTRSYSFRVVPAPGPSVPDETYNFNLPNAATWWLIGLLVLFMVIAGGLAASSRSD